MSGVFHCVGARDDDGDAARALTLFRVDVCGSCSLDSTARKGVGLILRDALFSRSNFSLLHFLPQRAERGTVVLDQAGVYVLEIVLLSPWSLASSEVNAARLQHEAKPSLRFTVIHSLRVAVATAAFAPGVMSESQLIDANDFHARFARGHAIPPVETTNQIGVKITAEMRPCSGCSMVRWEIMPLPNTTSYGSVLFQCIADRPLPRPIPFIGWRALHRAQLG